MRFLVVTGLSGAGKTSVNRYLEDMGAFCVDNLPPPMISRLIDGFEKTRVGASMVAMAVDVRSAELFDAKTVSDMIAELRVQGYSIECLFLEASDEALVSRYKETRREHPLARQGVTLTEAIAHERSIMQPLRETANYIIDTTSLKTRQLKSRLQGILSGETHSEAMRVEISSFGFKRGLPRQADLVYDVRFLPNPFYIEGLGRHTGLDEDVREFVIGNPITQDFLKKLEDLLLFLLPHYQEEGKRSLSIGVGCTGGAHRSVAIAEYIGGLLRERGWQATVTHRDLLLEQALWKSSAEAK